jgi:adenylate kinase
LNIILFGAPGSGKGTQSTLLVERLGFKQISTGDLFRAAIKNGTELGLKAKSFMDAGKLVPDEVVIGMVEEVLKNTKDSFILDGFPRTLDQAKELGILLGRLKMDVGRVIFLVVKDDSLVSRLSGRRVCKSCGAVYHIQSKPTRQENVCDSCGGQVHQRSDDKIEVISERLKVYKEQTAPVKDFYERLGKVVEIDGGLSTEDVYQQIAKIVS